ncbi:MAG: anaerobic glycerol-3-phosphate dehydrogenase subunit C [Planctomycetaceae bacterium]
MDSQQQRIVDELAGVFEGELRFDALTRSHYSTDASLYQVMPLGVACPRHREDVVALAKYAAEIGLPLISRGSGSGLAGGALGAGLIVDFSRHMTQVLEIGEDSVRVQPGVIRDQLNKRLREKGRYFPPDPSNTAISTIGGMIGVDSAGSHAVRVGSTRDHVRSLEVVLMGGVCFEAGLERLSTSADQTARFAMKSPNGELNGTSTPGSGPTQNGGTTEGLSGQTSDGLVMGLSQATGVPSGLLGAALSDFDGSDPSVENEHNAAVKRTIISRMRGLLETHRDLIQKYQPPIIRNCAGYHLRSVLTEDRIDLPRLLIGSEGTLGMFTAATLHTAPIPAARGVALLLFGRMESALNVVPAIAQLQPSACDLLDRRLLSLSRESDPRFEKLIPNSAEAALVVEQTGYNARQARDRIRMVIDAATRVDSSVYLAAEAYDPDDIEALWSLSVKVVPNLTRLIGNTRPQPFVEDIAVPPEMLRDFLTRAHRVLQKHDITASMYAHAASGQVHLRPFLPMPTSADGHRIEALARELYDLAISVGGTITGEHGDGLSRTAFLRTQYGPLYRVFRLVKDVFDPHNLLNPGKIISDDPHLTIRHLRPAEPAVAVAPTNGATRASAPTENEEESTIDSKASRGDAEPLSDGFVPLQLQWGPAEMAAAAMRCNGCGSCRTQDESLRMCPFFRVELSEEASPRSKANMMRNYASGQLERHELASEDFRRVAASCFNCKQCRVECSANVDIPGLMLEARAEYIATFGVRRADWVLSRAHSFGRLGCVLAPLSNWLLGSRSARYVIEKLFGIAKERKLPTFAGRTFLKRFKSSGTMEAWKQDAERPVVYFVDHFANYHDPELGVAFLKVMEHHGVSVIVPPDQTASGMAMISAGDLDAARTVAAANVRELAGFAREGYRIVCTEPAATLCLKEEYPRILGSPDVQVIAQQACDAGTFLLGLHEKKQLKQDFAPLDLTVGIHTPCHAKALGQAPWRSLISQIPGLKLVDIDLGCSGMAGAYGLSATNFDKSIQIGAPLIERMQQPDLNIGMTECSSCRMQMQQGTKTPTLHPIKLLALAYGLMPELRHRLKPTKRKLVMS